MWKNILQKKARGSARRVDHNALTEAVRTVTEELRTFSLEDVMDDIKNAFKIFKNNREKNELPKHLQNFYI